LWALGTGGSAAMSRVRRPRRSGTLFQTKSAKFLRIPVHPLDMGGIFAPSCAHFKQILCKQRQGCAESRLDRTQSRQSCAPERLGCTQAKLGCAQDKLGCAQDNLGYAQVKPGCAQVKLGCAQVKLGCAQEKLGYAQSKAGCAQDTNAEGVCQFQPRAPPWVRVGVKSNAYAIFQSSSVAWPPANRDGVVITSLTLTDPLVSAANSRSHPTRLTLSKNYRYL